MWSCRGQLYAVEFVAIIQDLLRRTMGDDTHVANVARLSHKRLDLVCRKDRDELRPCCPSCIEEVETTNRGLLYCNAFNEHAVVMSAKDDIHHVS